MTVRPALLHCRAVGPAAGCLRAGDVLLSFDGTPIANDGTILFRPRERISFEHLVSLKVTNLKG